MSETVDHDVIARFFEAIFREMREDHHPISVTNIISCLRRGYYAAIIPEEIIEMGGKIRTWIGKKIHETPLCPKSEVELSYGGVHGRIDEYDPGRRMLIEKKSVRSTPKKPYDHHVKQVQYYRVLLERNNMPVEKAAILYINVADAEAVAYPIDISQPLEEIEKEMLERGRKLREALKAGVLPPREMGWMCMNYCIYFGFCFSDYSPPVPQWVLEKLKE